MIQGLRFGSQGSGCRVTFGDEGSGLRKGESAKAPSGGPRERERERGCLDYYRRERKTGITTGTAAMPYGVRARRGRGCVLLERQAGRPPPHVAAGVSKGEWSLLHSQKGRPGVLLPVPAARKLLPHRPAPRLRLRLRFPHCVRVLCSGFRLCGVQVPVEG